jgi:hypothetical protein
MDLPELGPQWIYARVAWGMVCAALVFALLPAAQSARVRGIAAGLVALSMWLPGAASPAHWLALMFQYPSVMLAVFCAVAAVDRAAGRGVGAPAVPRPSPLAPAFALALAVGGALLYLDAAGWLHLDIYARGAEPIVAPVAALLLGAAAVAWIARAQRLAASASLPPGTAPAWGLLAAIAVFSAMRLPTGNLFDSLLDPLLWLWASATTLRIAAHVLWRR